MTVTYGDLTIDWLGYATVRLAADDTVIYLDPGRYGVLTGEWDPDSSDAADAHPPATDYRPSDADVVCVTHNHHYDPDAIERVATDETTILAFEGINTHQTTRELQRLGELPYTVRKVGQETQGVVKDTLFWTVPAYNDPEGPHTRADGTPIHPEGFGCGFLLSLGETTVFWTGDTDVLEGHAELDADILLPPIGGTLTMDRQGAAALAADLQPDLVVPIHYNTFEAIETDSAAFAADVASRGIPVALDEHVVP